MLTLVQLFRKEQEQAGLDCQITHCLLGEGHLCFVFQADEAQSAVAVLLLLVLLLLSDTVRVSHPGSCVMHAIVRAGATISYEMHPGSLTSQGSQ